MPCHTPTVIQRGESRQASVVRPHVEPCDYQQIFVTSKIKKTISGFPIIFDGEFELKMSSNNNNEDDDDDYQVEDISGAVHQIEDEEETDETEEDPFWWLPQNPNQLQRAVSFLGSDDYKETDEAIARRYGNWVNFFIAWYNVSFNVARNMHTHMYDLVPER